MVSVGVISPYKAKYKLKYEHALSTEIFKFTFFLQAYPNECGGNREINQVQNATHSTHLYMVPPPD